MLYGRGVNMNGDKLTGALIGIVLCGLLVLGVISTLALVQIFDHKDNYCKSIGYDGFSSYNGCKKESKYVDSNGMVMVTEKLTLIDKSEGYGN